MGALRFTSAPHSADLASPESVGRGRRAHGRACQSAQGRDSCKVPGFDPRCPARYRPPVGAINGASTHANKLSGDRLTAPVRQNIRIIDDPLRRRDRSQPFDAEGVRVKELAIIDGGILTSWLLDCATARELGMVTTGHAHRGVSSSPSPGAYNLHLEAGEPSPAELISDIRQGFYVTDLIGSGVNGLTGDYSRGASGFCIENGKITYPVSEGRSQVTSISSSR
jgi:PmbA protein